MEVPMLNDEEYKIASRLYAEGIKGVHGGSNMLERFKPLLAYYKEVTGWDETVPNAIMHHGISIYGPPCEHCGKPYRTPKATFCAACGHKRTSHA